jgi:L-threonylcarbamoyladenylate synthase
MPTKLQSPPYVIGMPTETVYGLAARIDQPQGIEAIFKIKERPFFDPLIVHVASLEQAQSLTTDWSKAAEILAGAFWPGPLTLVLPKSTVVSELITSGLQTVGIRMPRHPKALALIRGEAMPLAAPSANKFGKTSPTEASHVRSEFGDLVEVIDGGACEVGLESTVLLLKTVGEMTELSILRPGAINADQISSALVGEGLSFRWNQAVSKKESPGHMKHHYMPAVPLVYVLAKSNLGFAGLDKNLLTQITNQIQTLPEFVDEVRLIRPLGEIKNVQELILSSNPALAARELYSQLRVLGAKKSDIIVFYEKDFHQETEWEALLDRLTKAASIIV